MNLFLDNISKESVGDAIELTSIESLELGYEIASLESTISKDVLDMSNGVDVLLNSSVDATIYATVLGIGQLSLEDKKGVLAKAWKAVKEFAITLYNNIKNVFSKILKWFKNLFSKKDDSKEQKDIEDFITKSLRDDNNELAKNINSYIASKIAEYDKRVEENIKNYIDNLKKKDLKSINVSLRGLQSKIDTIEAGDKINRKDIDVIQEKLSRIDNDIDERNKLLDELIPVLTPPDKDIDDLHEDANAYAIKRLNELKTKLEKHLMAINIITVIYDYGFVSVSIIDDIGIDCRNNNIPKSAKGFKKICKNKIPIIEYDKKLITFDIKKDYNTIQLLTSKMLDYDKLAKDIEYSIRVTSEIVEDEYEKYYKNFPGIPADDITAAKIKTTKAFLRYFNDTAYGLSKAMKFKADIYQTANGIYKLLKKMGEYPDVYKDALDKLNLK